MTRITEMSPSAKARLAGALYLIIIVSAIFAEMFVRERLVVYSDAAVTAANITASESLYRAGGVAMLVAISCDVVVALLLYRLLRPVSKTAALLAAAFRLVQVAVLGVNLQNHFAPLLLLRTTEGSTVFAAEQLQAQALAALRMYAQGFNLAMVFFGFGLMFLGYLIFKSTFLPRLLGILAVIAGACYLTNSIAGFLSPTLASQLFPLILVPCFIGELSLTMWLLIVGVNVKRWNEQAGVSSARAA